MTTTTNRARCPGCGIPTIPDREGLTAEMMMCDRCATPPPTSGHSPEPWTYRRAVFDPGYAAHVTGGNAATVAGQVANPFSIAGKGAGAALKSNAATRLNTKVIVPKAEQVRKTASAAFDAAEANGGVLTKDVANKFYSQIMGIRPQTVEGRVFKGESPVTKIFDQIPGLMDRPMTLRAAKEIDEALGDMAYSTMDTAGKLSADGIKFLGVQTALRKMIDAADEGMVHGGKEGFEALKKGRELWSTSLKMRDVERIIENAERMDHPAAAIRTGFRTLLRHGDRTKGYSPAEMKALEKAATTGVVTDILRLAGSGLVPVGSGIAGTVAGGPLGGLASAAAGGVVQQSAKALATARQTGRANAALRSTAESGGMVSRQPRISIPAPVSNVLGSIDQIKAAMLAQALSQAGRVKEQSGREPLKITVRPRGNKETTR